MGITVVDCAPSEALVEEPGSLVPLAPQGDNNGKSTARNIWKPGRRSTRQSITPLMKQSGWFVRRPAAVDSTVGVHLRMGVDPRHAPTSKSTALS